MHEYISLLRGINVGGKTLKMANLVDIYESLDLRDVRTYIQSGNVLFNTTAMERNKIKGELELQIRDRFGLSVTAFIFRRNEFQEIIERNPLAGTGGRELGRLHVTFLEKKPEEELVERLPPDKNTADEYRVIGTEVYLYCPGGYGKTPLSNSFFEKNLAVRATTRNWRTVNRLYQISIGKEVGKKRRSNLKGFPPERGSGGEFPPLISSGA
jgi:uncharacterized protein (DUF1697 family)